MWQINNITIFTHYDNTYIHKSYVHLPLSIRPFIRINNELALYKSSRNHPPCISFILLNKTWGMGVPGLHTIALISRHSSTIVNVVSKACIGVTRGHHSRPCSDHQLRLAHHVHHGLVFVGVVFFLSFTFHLF